MNRQTGGPEKFIESMDKARNTVLHIITDLKYGGAEMMLLKLLSANDGKFQPIVVSLTGSNGLTSRFRELGITVHSLELNPSFPNPIKLIKLVCLIRRVRPVVVQTWMYHADLLGGVTAKIAGVKHVVWNIRNSGLAPKSTKLATKLTVHLCSLLSHVIPSIILTNSYVAASTHKAKGYKNEIFRVIPNGFDTTKFKADESARSSIRTELGLNCDSRLIGLIARFHRQKNHFVFLEAAAILNKQRDDQTFLLAGLGVNKDNVELINWINHFELRESVILLGVRDDISNIVASLDVCTLSSSYGEAFPNVIGEAMCCEVPVVTTDVGDSAYIVGDTGIVVQANNPEALAEAWCNLLSMTDDQRRAYGELGRQRVKDNFTIAVVSTMYEDLYTELFDNSSTN